MSDRRLTMCLLCELLVACKIASQLGLRAYAAHSLLLSHPSCCPEEAGHRLLQQKHSSLI